jgi:hypothetical protein
MQGVFCCGVFVLIVVSDDFIEELMSPKPLSLD